MIPFESLSHCDDIVLCDDDGFAKAFSVSASPVLALAGGAFFSCSL